MPRLGSTHRPTLLPGLFCCLVLLLGPGRSAAQEAAPPHDDVISANPFLLLAEWFNAEWEHRIRPTGTLGLAGSFISLDGGDDDYRSIAAFWRYFPQERAPDGFFIGPRLGFHSVDEGLEDESETALGLGVEIGYTWLLGSSDSFALSIGFGASRLLGLDTDAEAILPTVRLINVGWAF